MHITREMWTALETKVNILLEERNAEIQKLREEVKQYYEIKDSLKSIKLKVKKAQYIPTADSVIVEYETPTVVLEFDDGKQVTKNDFLRITNTLGIVGLEDQMKIQKEILKATERRNNGK